MEEPLLAPFAFVLDVKQLFTSAAAVCGLQIAAAVPIIEFQIIAREKYII